MEIVGDEVQNRY